MKTDSFLNNSLAKLSSTDLGNWVCETTVVSGLTKTHVTITCHFFPKDKNYLGYMCQHNLLTNLDCFNVNEYRKFTFGLIYQDCVNHGQNKHKELFTEVADLIDEALVRTMGV